MTEIPKPRSITVSTSAILFDVGNVILRSTHAITHAILWELGVRPNKAALFFQGPHYAGFARGQISDATFADAVRHALEAPHLTDRDIRKAHDAHIYMVDIRIASILEHLHHDSDCPIAFATTTNEWQTARERELIDLAGRFGPVFRSHEVGCTKTDPDAWGIILEKVGWAHRDPATILLVDDSRESCSAAHKAGLGFHVYDPSPHRDGPAELRNLLQACGALS